MSRTAHPVRFFLASLAAAAVTGCADSSNARQAVVDSLLARDLTLASASAPPTGGFILGDTAAASIKGAAVESAVPAVARPATIPRQQVASRAARSPSPQRAPNQTPELRQNSSTTGAQTKDSIQNEQRSQPTTPAAGRAPGTPATSPGAAIASGTVLAGSTTQEICSIANRPGDRFVATLDNAVTGPGGSSLPAGTPILVQMVAAPDGQFDFRVLSVQVKGELIPIEGTVATDGATTSRRVAKGGDKGKVVGGAVAGAILGTIIGGDKKGAVIGAAGGVAAGTIAASRNSTVEHCLPKGVRLTVTLSSPLVLASGSP